MSNAKIPSLDHGRQRANQTLRKSSLTVSASALAVAFVLVGEAAAQEQAVETASADAERITVTGTRIARNGYSAPTPLTVLDQQELDAGAPANLADFVNQIPSVVGSATPQTSNASISSGAAGVNSINLRNLGAARTLVLLDGRRSSPSLINGTVDVNTFPQALIERVEIVTGGASAAYGSDAVSGVVNFILDKDFEGFEAVLEAGQTTYGDDNSWKVELTGGVPFDAGRGHLLLNIEKADREGIYGVPRDWNDDGWYIMNNPTYTPTNGQPERLLVANAGLSTATRGGIIVNTPLRGTYFGAGGTVNQFEYGDITRDPWTVGGDWEVSQANSFQALHADERREGVFGRLSYEISPAIELYGEAAFNKHASLGWTGVQYNNGNVRILSDNAFIPEEVAMQLADLGLESFNLGTTNADLPLRKTDNQREVSRFVIGANGEFSVFGQNWGWDAYAQQSKTETLEIARDISNNQRLAWAQDAVIDPVSGDIVCRITLTDPTEPCVPFNRMGIGVNSQEALDYIIGHPTREQEFTQEVAAVNFTGEPFSIWAGPVSLAFGAEYRKEQVSGFVEEQYQSGWFVGNYRPSFGEYDVTEGYVETLVPLFEGFEFNGAVRVTDYSTSGAVTTWKAGFTYSPVPDLTLRLTRSRDIRAPNLAELFQAGSTRTNNLVDPFNNNQVVQFRETVSGNTALEPEEADVWGAGFIYQPSYIPGLGVSVDYYEIELEGAIGNVSAPTIVERCFEGQQVYCAAITRGANPDGASVIEEVRVSPFNFAERIARGVDVEGSYQFDLADVANALNGSLTLRGMATFYLENYNNNGIDTPTDTVGASPPDWLYRVSASYQLEDLRLTLTGRGLAARVYDTSFIECTADCPTSTPDNRTINNNDISGAFYLDSNVSYLFNAGGETETELFFNVKNLLNEDPETYAYGPGGVAYGNPSTDQSYYDILGRVFRVGARIRF